MKFVAIIFVFLLSGYAAAGQEPEQDKSFGWKEGVLGVAVVAMAGYILKIEADHKAERKEWQKVIMDQFEAQNKSTSEHVGLLKGIQALLETENRILNKRTPR